MIRELQIQYLSIIIIFIHSLSCEDNIIETDNTKEYGVVINEINYNSSDSFNPDDWVELYNNSNDTIDITSWLLKDEKDDHIFIIPSNTILLPNQYIILCKDTIKFIDAFPDVLFKYGDFGFGLGGGSDAIRLFDANGTLADFVEYDDDLPWPLAADGEGPTLELKNPSLDNLLPENWMASEGNGTPGLINSTYYQ